jgi:hypothetical protein
MTLPQMAAFAIAGQRIDPKNIETFVIDANYLIGWRGAGGASLYIPDLQKITPLIDEFQRPGA